MKTELALVSKLKPHPRNYRKHPAEQLAHIQASIKQHGFYRNVVVAKDDTILAGHGVVQAAKEMKIKQVPVFRVPVGPNDPRALKIIAADNELGNLAEVDSRVLAKLLKDTARLDSLLGTGFDDDSLAALLKSVDPKMVEFQAFDESAKDDVKFVVCPKCKHRFAA